MRKGALAMTLLAGLSAAGCGGVPETIMGAQATAASARAAIDVAEMTVRGLIEAFTSQNQLDWGRPQAIVQRKDKVYVVYSTPESELRAGRPRVLIVNQKDGYVRRAIRGERWTDSV
jgi:hypothetical protein